MMLSVLRKTRDEPKPAQTTQNQPKQPKKCETIRNDPKFQNRGIWNFLVALVF